MPKFTVTIEETEVLQSRKDIEIEAPDAATAHATVFNAWQQQQEKGGGQDPIVLPDGREIAPPEPTDIGGHVHTVAVVAVNGIALPLEQRVVSDF